VVEAPHPIEAEVLAEADSTEQVIPLHPLLGDVHTESNPCHASDRSPSGSPRAWSFERMVVGSGQTSSDLRACP